MGRGSGIKHCWQAHLYIVLLANSENIVYAPEIGFIIFSYTSKKTLLEINTQCQLAWQVCSAQLSTAELVRRRQRCTWSQLQLVIHVLPVSKDPDDIEPPGIRFLEKTDNIILDAGVQS